MKNEIFIPKPAKGVLNTNYPRRWPPGRSTSNIHQNAEQFEGTDEEIDIKVKLRTRVSNLVHMIAAVSQEYRLSFIGLVGVAKM
jgi:hypothetical protein